MKVAMSTEVRAVCVDVGDTGRGTFKYILGEMYWNLKCSGVHASHWRTMNLSILHLENEGSLACPRLLTVNNGDSEW